MERLRQRFQALNGNDLDDPYAFIAKKFNHANRITNYSNKERTRLKRYGKETIFFRCSNFTFVVQNATIVTIEISDKGKRYLNAYSGKNEPPIELSTDDYL